MIGLGHYLTLSAVLFVLSIAGMVINRRNLIKLGAATTAGLIIALTAVIPQSVFNRWSDEIEPEIEEVNSEVVEFILTHH